MKLDPIYFNATNKLKNLQEHYNNSQKPEKVKANKAVHKGSVGVFLDVTLGRYGSCYYCQEVTKTNRDHFYPKSLGGLLIVISCVECNKQKDNLIPSEWLKKVDKLQNYSRARKDFIIQNTRNLIEKIINDGLERPLNL